eukprot:CAMPEP_0171319790 /NCGR_PEP_ID=MMETSP0816-20121228/99352_1 /TAXON_ID=420281 /ORGANISM="Proboscia inermis, Strain CCAP1064/1" /LENGTH=69 /DNA_ID=CAMNT_0011815893 /DNA_START=685 /DNA_END=891 /DNA_ORIENTATION=+
MSYCTRLNDCFVQTVYRGVVTEKFMDQAEFLDEKKIVVGGNSMLYPPHHLSKWNVAEEENTKGNDACEF